MCKYVLKQSHLLLSIVCANLPFHKGSELERMSYVKLDDGLFAVHMTVSSIWFYFLTDLQSRRAQTDGKGDYFPLFSLSSSIYSSSNMHGLTLLLPSLAVLVCWPEAAARQLHKT